jgi:hypothetical protein
MRVGDLIGCASLGVGGAVWASFLVDRTLQGGCQIGAKRGAWLLFALLVGYFRFALVGFFSCRGREPGLGPAAEFISFCRCTDRRHG